MNSRRNDPLRYLFNPPIPCLLRASGLNKEVMSNLPVEAEMLDLSRNGCKIELPTHFQTDDPAMKLMITFQLSDSLQLNGQVRWHEKKWNSYAYGIKFEDHTPQDITDQLKLFVKKLRQDLAASMPGRLGQQS